MLELKSLRKEFGATVAVRDADLTIREGEFFSLLGPSGCGKTTLLRLLAGFEAATSGEIRLGGARIDHLPPNERPFNMVFQRYALFPHLDVAGNVGFGLRMKGVPSSEARGRVDEALALVKLEGFRGRGIATLSGGQSQRVALARALVNRPRLLLLDEPLSALDLKLRQQMQVELVALQRRLGTTFIFVTHDQEEALTLSHRIAVMSEGVVEQVGTPREIYERPLTPFVARFVGHVNAIGTDFMIRPERIRLSRAGVDVGAGMSFVEGVIREVLFQGPLTRVYLRVDGGGEGLEELLISIPNAPGSHETWRAGERARASWRSEDCTWLEGEVRG